MVMIFQSKKALARLLKEKSVATFRKNRRRETGHDWITDHRGGKKIAEVMIREEGLYSPSALSEFVFLSGFSSLQEWKNEIQKLNNGRLPKEGWLYHVVFLWRPKKKTEKRDSCFGQMERFNGQDCFCHCEDFKDCFDKEKA